jgi:hypothetical protein
MPTLTTTVLTDREATPVDHSFVPRDIVNGQGTLVETTGVPVGESKLQVALNRNTAGKFKPNLKLVVPVVQTQVISGISTPVVVRTSYVDLTVTFDPTSTEQERKNVMGMLYDAVGAGTAFVNDTFVKLEGVY